MRELRLKSAASFLLLVALAGCMGYSVPDPKWPNPVVVTGIVKLADQPLADTLVSFIPNGSTPGPGASAFTNSAGEYKLQTRWADKSMKDGAIPGKYKVMISRKIKKDGSAWKPNANNSEGPMVVGAREELAETYADPTKTTLTAEVSQNSGKIDFNLDKKKK